MNSEAQRSVSTIWYWLMHMKKLLIWFWSQKSPEAFKSSVLRVRTNLRIYWKSLQCLLWFWRNKNHSLRIYNTFIYYAFPGTCHTARSHTSSHDSFTFFFSIFFHVDIFHVLELQNIFHIKENCRLNNSEFFSRQRNFVYTKCTVEKSVNFFSLFYFYFFSSSKCNLCFIY